MDSKAWGLLVAAAGGAAIVIGLLIYSGALSWFGRLPGDVRIKTDTGGILIPFTSMILVSVALSAGLALLRRIF